MNGSITERVVKAVMGEAERIDLSPHADVVVRVQDGYPVLVEVNSKHKIRGANRERHVSPADFGPDGTFRPK